MPKETTKKGVRDMPKRVRPLLDVNSIYEDWSEYPTKIRVTMEDGSVQHYCLEVKQPAPNFSFMEAMDALERMFDCFTVEEPKERKYRRNR